MVYFSYTSTYIISVSTLGLEVKWGSKGLMLLTKQKATGTDITAIQVAESCYEVATLVLQLQLFQWISLKAWISLVPWSFQCTRIKRGSLESNCMWQMLPQRHEREVADFNLVYQLQFMKHSSLRPLRILLHSLSMKALAPYLPSMSNWSAWKYTLSMLNYHDLLSFRPIWSYTCHMRMDPRLPLFTLKRSGSLGDEVRFCPC